jgi:hypothetical protein
MVARPRCNSKVRNDGNARAQRKTLGIPAECLAVSAALITVHLLTHTLSQRSAARVTAFCRAWVQKRPYLRARVLRRVSGA